MSNFLQGYVTAALWSSTDDDGEPLDSLYSVDEIAPETLAEMVEDCIDFQESNATELSETGAGDARNGHDFWLTRNRHGAGFWDRGYGAIGDKLSEAARVYGSVDLYIGDDGRIHA